MSVLLGDAVLEFKKTDTTIKEKITSWFTRRYKIKAAVFTLVFIIWLIFAGQQNFEKKINLPITFKNIPSELMVSEPIDQKISITCRGLRKDVSLLNENNIITSIDLFSAKSGTSFYTISAGNLTLPNDRIHVVHITPSKMELTLERRLKSNQEDKSSVEKEPI